MLKIKAKAKINLTLKVYRKKIFDKRHRIYSKMVVVSNLYDEITIEINNSGNDLITSNIHLYKQNVIIFVMDILRKYKVITKNYNIHIKKNIPLYSGLGGFSSIASSLALHFIRKINNKLKMKIIKDICKKVGSDCWFFFSELNAAIVSGYGEKVQKFYFENKIKKSDLLFIPVECKTDVVYKTFDKYKLWKYENNENMLTRAIEIAYPEIKEMYDYHNYFFSGSGSTVVKKSVRTY